MSLNVQLPKNRWNDVKEFIFASLIIAAAFSAGTLIYKNGDSMALTPVTSNTATVINAY